MCLKEWHIYPICVHRPHLWTQGLHAPFKAFARLEGNSTFMACWKSLYRSLAVLPLPPCTKENITMTLLGYGPPSPFLLSWPISWQYEDTGGKCVCVCVQISQESPIEDIIKKERKMVCDQHLQTHFWLRVVMLTAAYFQLLLVAFTQKWVKPIQDWDNNQ